MSNRIDDRQQQQRMQSDSLQKEQFAQRVKDERISQDDAQNFRRLRNKSKTLDTPPEEKKDSQNTKNNIYNQMRTSKEDTQKKTPPRNPKDESQKTHKNESQKTHKEQRKDSTDGENDSSTQAQGKPKDEHTGNLHSKQGNEGTDQEPKPGEQDKDAQFPQSGNEDKRMKEDAPPLRNDLALGDRMLANFYGHYAQPSAAGQAAAPAARVQDIGDYISTMSERIMLSRPKDGNESSLRLQLKDSLLPGTALTVTRGKDGAMEMTFESTREESTRFLHQHKQKLLSHLMRKGSGGANLRLEIVDQSGHDQ